jgi:hypothetical protein
MSGAQTPNEREWIEWERPSHPQPENSRPRVQARSQSTRKVPAVLTLDFSKSISCSWRKTRVPPATQTNGLIQTPLRPSFRRRSENLPSLGRRPSPPSCLCNAEDNDRHLRPRSNCSSLRSPSGSGAPTRSTQAVGTGKMLFGTSLTAHIWLLLIYLSTPYFFGSSGLFRPECGKGMHGPKTHLRHGSEQKYWTCDSLQIALFSAELARI